MCGSAVFCVSRTYCSSAPAAQIASGRSSAPKPAQVERAELVGQQARGARELEVPGWARALVTRSRSISPARALDPPAPAARRA